MGDIKIPTTFAIAGGGWRTGAYINIAAAMPELFKLGGMFVRNREKGAVIEARHGIPTFRSLDEMLTTAKPDFVVTSVPWQVNPGVIDAIVAADVAVLSETPPAPDLEGLLSIYNHVEAGAKIQVAEQYNFQPFNAARISLVHSGRLGNITQAQVSISHGYHGISIMRRLLGTGFKNCTVSGRIFSADLVEGPGRYGLPEKESIIVSRQQIIQFDWEDRLGILDFTGDQYFSWVRNERLLVRGDRGEIINEHATWLADYRTPISADFIRQETGQRGNLEGRHLKGYLLGGEWIYSNPCGGARLSDDEIAIATSLQSMVDYLHGGNEFYSVADACQDHYLSLLAEKAISSGEKIASEDQPWTPSARSV